MNTSRTSESTEWKKQNKQQKYNKTTHTHIQPYTYTHRYGVFTTIQNIATDWKAYCVW